MKKVHIRTLGCKVNTFDSRALENQFISNGYALSDNPADADVNVINSCSVTSNAEKEARYLLRRYKRENPDGLRVITGCYAQTDSSKLASMEEVDFVIPNEAKSELIPVVSKGLSLTPEERKLQSKLPEGISEVSENKQGHFKSSAVFFDQAQSESQTRAFLKIQDGCNGFCSYCLIPYARGASSSVQPDKVIAEVNRLVENGTREIVFTGIHIGDYGEDLNENTHGISSSKTESEIPFVNLLAEILENENLKRVRISSLEPMEASEDLIKLLKLNEEKACNHFHLPLQSGNNRILKMMRRKYDCARYQESIKLVRKYFPTANITADVIPGFPGETEEEFQSTMKFIRDVGLNGLHVFPYSKRPNTAAAKMPGHLDQSIVKSRASKLRALSAELEQEYARDYLGHSMEVLWEKSTDDSGRLKGKTKNYLNVVASASAGATRGLTSLVTLKGFVEKNTFLGL